MKMLKKLTSFLVVAMLIMGMATTAFAAGTTYTITINNTTDGHTYEAYQIFAGDLAADGTLSNITWGTGINTAATGFPYASPATASSVAGDLAAGTITAADFAEAIASYLSTTKVTSAYNTTNYTIANLNPGYYLVKDQNGTLTGENESYTNYILEVVKNVSVTPKADVPEVEKKVKDTNDTTGVTSNWEDSADYDIGDDVPFQLTGTLPDNYATYTTYKYVFHDTLSAGLTYNNDVKVYVDNAGTETEITSSFTVTSSGTALTISCADLKAITGVTINASSKIVVRYTAELNTNAVIGSAGNPNECYLEFSNNPNGTGEGQTPEDEVKVYTYKVVINKVEKVNSVDTALNGAAFKLEKKDSNGNWVEISTIGPGTATDPITTFEFKGLDEGDYKLTETTTPAGYNTIDPIEFTIGATHSDAALSTLTATPADAFTVVLNDGALTADVENQKGSTLPSTGGIGTTIFYVVGSLLVVGAVIVLITRKKMTAVK